MTTTRQAFRFSLAALLLVSVLPSLSMIGGMLGVASGFGQSTMELSPLNRQMACILGLLIGSPPALSVAMFLHFYFRRRFTAIAASAITAVSIPAIALHVVSVYSAAC